MKRLLFLPLAACSVLALACAIPISSADQTATAVAAEQPLSSLGGSTESSQRADNPSVSLSLDATFVPDVTPLPLATRGPLIETTPDGTAAALVASSATATTTLTAKDTPAATNTPPPGATTVATPTPAPSETTPPQPGGDLAAQALDLINQQRAARGLAALELNPSMANDAAAYAQYMGVNDFFGHYAPDGSSPQSRLTAAGYKGHYRGEALFAGASSASQTIDALLASPAHAAILLDDTANEAGVGFFSQPGSTYQYYWVVVTGSR